MKIPAPVPVDQYNQVPEEFHKAIRLVGVMFGRDAAIKFGRELCKPSGKYQFVGTYPDFDDVPAELNIQVVNGTGDIDKFFNSKTGQAVREALRDLERRQR